jgi:VIT1/CCC1 family predicted Fe2+/Mn2+ transporter
VDLPAIILALLAIAVFIVAYLNPQPPRKWASVALGLALLAAAWVVQSIFVGLHQYSVH